MIELAIAVIVLLASLLTLGMSILILLAFVTIAEKLYVEMDEDDE